MINWSDYFEYRNGILYWKVRRNGRNGGVKPGDVAGCKNSRGYIVFNYKGKQYRAHRVIWQIHNGDIPSNMEIDHINHDKTDNRIENLRLVDRTENGRNQSRRNDNSSGFCGVHWHKPLSKWCARIRVNGKLVHLGYFDKLDDAKIARIEANKKFNFHKNHGR